MLPRYGPQPHKIVRQRLQRLLGHVGWFSAQRRVDRDEVALSCWGLGRVGRQHVWDVALAAPPTQEVVQHTAGQDNVSGDVWVQLHVAKEAAESVRHHAERVFGDTSAVRPLQMFSEGERPVAHNHVGALHVCLEVHGAVGYGQNTLLHALVQSAVPLDAPVSVAPSLPAVDVDEFQVCVD